jgi:hypothetical protein
MTTTTKPKFTHTETKREVRISESTVIELIDMTTEEIQHTTRLVRINHINFATKELQTLVLQSEEVVNIVRELIRR